MSGNKLVQLLNQYDHEHTILETNKTVGIKPITTGQMKNILQYENEEDVSVVEKILDEIILGCVSSDGFNLDDLTIQDRFELLIGIRKITKGNEYSFNIKCPKCGIESIQLVKLDTLDFTPFPINIDRDIKINDKLTLSLDFIRRGNQKQASELVDGMGGKLTDSQKMSEIATFMYAFGISNVKTNVGELTDITIHEKKEFLDNLKASDYEVINDWYEKNTYGTNFKYKVKCNAGTSCDYEKEEDIPITGFFF